MPDKRKSAAVSLQTKWRTFDHNECDGNCRFHLGEGITKKESDLAADVEEQQQALQAKAAEKKEQQAAAAAAAPEPQEKQQPAVKVTPALPPLIPSLAWLHGQHSATILLASRAK